MRSWTNRHPTLAVLIAMLVILVVLMIAGTVMLLAASSGTSHSPPKYGLLLKEM